MNTTWLKQLGTGILVSACLGAAGCGSTAPVADDQAQQVVAPSALPDLPGCEEITVRGNRIAVRQVQGVVDLFALFADDKPVCLDSQEGISGIRAESMTQNQNPFADTSDQQGSSGGVTSNPFASDPMPILCSACGNRGPLQNTKQ
jgi:hypothetical protein